MNRNAPHDLILLRQGWSRGDRDALDKLIPLVDKVVELRFFGRLSVGEAAEVLKVPPVTVTRDWRAAKAWLLSELARRHGDGS